MAWPGLVIASGGQLSATYLEIRNASTGITTMAGASFTIDHLVIESCDALMDLASGGTVAHTSLN